MSEPTELLYRPGLEGIIAGETTVAAVEQSGLSYRGYDIADLAEHTSFEECAHLLLYDDLPTPAALTEFRRRLDEQRSIPEPVIETIRRIPPEVGGMDVLRTAMSMTAHFDPGTGQGREALVRQAIRVLAQVPGIIGARMRTQAGQPPLKPKPGLSHAAQLLYLALGREPTTIEEKVVNLTLILYAEHEFNASTFAARVCTSTLSDLYSAVVAAIGTLKGPLHGGANEETMRLMAPFKSADEARTWTTAALARKEKVSGFGHRVYKHGDHRSHILEGYLPELAKLRNEAWRVEVYHAIKNTVWEQKKLHPNVDYPCGLAYYLLGLPLDVYTPIFVASRVSGWCAHIIEQNQNNRIIRPLSRYTGPAPRKVVPLAERR